MAAHDDRVEVHDATGRGACSRRRSFERSRSTFQNRGASSPSRKLVLVDDRGQVRGWRHSACPKSATGPGRGRTRSGRGSRRAGTIPWSVPEMHAAKEHCERRDERVSEDGFL